MIGQQLSGINAVIRDCCEYCVQVGVAGTERFFEPASTTWLTQIVRLGKRDIRVVHFTRINRYRRVQNVTR